MSGPASSAWVLKTAEVTGLCSYDQRCLHGVSAKFVTEFAYKLMETLIGMNCIGIDACLSWSRGSRDRLQSEGPRLGRVGLGDVRHQWEDLLLGGAGATGEEGILRAGRPLD